jgi:hypothetical protein
MADRRTITSAEAKAQVEAKLSEFSEQNKVLAARMHKLILEANPSLVPRLWYGMPGYAKTKDSAVLVFFREDEYMTFGLTEAAHHEVATDATTLLMPSAWFFTSLDNATEEAIVKIVQRATA